jgi:hypothetical protein
LDKESGVRSQEKGERRKKEDRRQKKERKKENFFTSLFSVRSNIIIWNISSC